MAHGETRFLREKPRINYYELEEPALDEYLFCEECGDYVYEYCAIHGPLLVIPDTKVSYKPDIPAIVPRAALTIPRVFLHLARSIIPGAGIGVFSTLTLPRGVRFGPYRGQRSLSPDSPYCWQIYDSERRRAHLVDASDAQRSNWMRYVNCARHWSEQNLVAFQYRGELYYRTIKIIPRFTELLVFYGSEYANTLGVNLGAYNAPLGYAAKFGARAYKKPRVVILEENLQHSASLNTEKEKKIKQDINNEKKIYKNDKPVIENNIICKNNVLKDIGNVDNSDGIKQILTHTHTNRIDEKIYDYPDKSMNDNNQENQTTIKDKLYKCNFCQKCFSHKCSLITHLRIHTGVKPYKCVHCQKCFSQKRNLITHLRIHTCVKPYTCEHCQKCFSIKSNLTTHLRIHTGIKPYKCEHCQKCFSIKSNLTTHLRIHTGIKPYKCEHCQKCFSHKCRLTTHLRIHTGVKPYKCEHCQKCFSHKCSLTTHLRIHTGVKSYTCEHCQKCFSQKCSLTTHLRIHTGVKPYKCEHCQKCFSMKRYLTEHLRIHTGVKPYKCEHCQKCFSTKHYLTTHLRIHTGVKPYKCEHCQKCFSQKNNLTRHLRIHTGVKPYSNI